MSTRQPPTDQSRRGSQSQQGRVSVRNGQRPQTYRTAVNLPQETQQAVVEMLNQSLADATDLLTQCKFAHWNVKGMNFYQLHLLFDEIAETFADHADVIAERATALGGVANGTARTAAANSRIPEMPPDATTGPEYVAALVERVGLHANNLRADIDAAMERGDQDTADMYTELSREVDKHLYFLEAHLQAVESEAIPANSGEILANPDASMQSQQSPEGEYRTNGGPRSRYAGAQTEGHQSRRSQGRRRYGSRSGY